MGEISVLFGSSKSTDKRLMIVARHINTRMRPEEELLLCCARTRLETETTARARALLASTLDWDYLLQLALSQRVMPLLYHQLKIGFHEAVPAEFMGRLHDYFYLNAARNHLLTEELCEIMRLLEQHGISAIPYKGPLLAVSVYRDMALRQFSDLDIFVHEQDVARVAEILSLLGYRKDHPLTPVQEARFLKIECEHTFTQDERRIYLDLHWGFVPSYFSLRLDCANFWKRAEHVSLETIETLSFAPEDLLLILCVNAGKECWDRLATLCDIAELLRVFPNLNWQAVVHQASEAGARRMLDLSLQLAHDLLGAVIPEELAAQIAADSEVQRLTLILREEMFEMKVKEQGISNFLKPAKALERWRDRAKFYLRLAITPTMEDWAFIKLPRPLFFLYYLTRPVRLAKKYLKHH
jgi:hypothetical protein